MTTEFHLVSPALGRLKVFPLPEGVLLPGGALPLRVFEPRYRALVREALRGDRVLAVAMLAPGWEAGYAGRPPLRPIAGAGLLEEAERQPDGTYHVLVRGVARVRLGREHRPEKLYREIEASLVEEIPLADPRQVETVRRALLPLSESLPEELAGSLSRAAAQVSDPGSLLDLVAAALFDDAQALQDVLEALDVEARLRRVLAELATMLLAAQPPPEGGLLS